MKTASKADLLVQPPLRLELFECDEWRGSRIMILLNEKSTLAKLGSNEGMVGDQSVYRDDLMVTLTGGPLPWAHRRRIDECTRRIRF